MQTILIFLQRPLNEWWLPLFFAMVFVTFALLILLGLWWSRRLKRLGLELDSPPPDREDYTLAAWTPFRRAKAWSLVAGVLLLSGIIGGTLTESEWRGAAMLPVLLAFPVLWVGLFMRVLPLRCGYCGERMMLYCESEPLGTTEKNTFHYFCVHCKSTVSDFTTT